MRIPSATPAVLALCALAAVPAVAQTPFETLNFLKGIEGRAIVSGEHNDQKDLDCGATGSTGARFWTEKVHDITGVYPALWGGDFLFHGNAALRRDVVDEAVRQWNAGAVVTLSWHVCPPTQNAVCDWDGGVKSSLTAAQFDELLTDGTELDRIWKSRVDEIAVYLQELKEAGVEVLWRPLHEQNQTVFWWNSQGPAKTAALWRRLHDYLTKTKGLDNLVWVWDVQDIWDNAAFADWDPGHGYWDVLALDVYADGLTNSSYYSKMVEIAGPNRLVAIGELFALPTDAQLQAMPRFAYFMNWAYGLKKWYAPDCRETNSDDHIKEVYYSARVLHLGDMPGWKGSSAPENLAKNAAVSVSSSEEGKNVPANAVDGSYRTRWASGSTDDEWIALDLGGAKLLDSVRLFWETARAESFAVELSDDGNAWRTAETVSGNESYANTVALGGAKGRHLRIRGVKRATEYGYSLFQIEAYGTAAPPEGEGESALDSRSATGRLAVSMSGSRELRYALPSGVSSRVRLQVVDLTGRVALELDSAPASGTLDLSGLPRGSYLVRLRSGASIWTARAALR